MGMRGAVFSGFLLMIASAARAQDAPFTPPLPSPGGDPGATSPAPTKAELDAAIERAIAGVLQRLGPGALPPAPSPQGLTGQAYAPAYAPAAYLTGSVQPITVLVPPGPIARGLAAIGRQLATLEQPRVRTLRVSPLYVAPTAPGAYVSPFATPSPQR